MDTRIFSIENTKTGEFRTFKLETMPEDSSFAPGKTVIYLLVGPSNSSDYRGFAFLGTNAINVWRKCRGDIVTGEKTDFEKFAALLSALLIEERTLSKYRMLDAVLCRRCGEYLTVPASIRRGVGPVCAEKMGEIAA